ncbi:MAG TPA: hypothetical protein VH740_09330 [Vicinamibacterales bacterium]|jgi:hypothetical protein
MIRSVAGVGSVVSMIALVWGGLQAAAGEHQSATAPPTFTPSDTCLACHNGLKTASGVDISIGSDWRGSMMANSARDPYWQASVRRETLDHPRAAEDIEDECATCHMPMARTDARASGRKGQVFAHLSQRSGNARRDLLAHDGVSCTMCHQISAQNLGSPESFTGGFVIDRAPSDGARPIFGPFQIDKGRTHIMRSSSGFRPAEGRHIQQSEICASCHTLYTEALGPDGEVVGRLPEQMPYLEWRASAYAREQASCQSCHMPVVGEHAPIASVLGEPREGVSRHGFRGGNFFMLKMLNRYRSELGVTALASELDAAAASTAEQLQSATASLRIERAVRDSGRLAIDLVVQNRAGHKLPTGYPARRVWIDLAVRDRNGRAIFESGAVSPNGAIAGNDNDSDPLRYEAHYTEIRRPDEVQIYESVMADQAGGVTTGLLKGVRYLKDNRLLPRGLDKTSAAADIAVIGLAANDPDFTDGGDRIRYAIDAAGDAGPFTVDVALRFQPIGYRWAQNLKPYDAVETRRFVSFYDSMSAASTEVLARASAKIPN